jgi:hypothetical protein
MTYLGGLGANVLKAAALFQGRAVAVCYRFVGRQNGGKSLQIKQHAPKIIRQHQRGSLPSLAGDRVGF